MECTSYIHHFLPDEINILDAEFDCLKRVQGINFQRSKADLFAVIDRMGQLSAKAQGLTGAITTGSKLLYSDHRLYVLKDTAPSSRQVIGILKVGPKNLFIYDMHGVQHEMSPLCVLDFYVHESRQRQGCGRKLFDFMLEKERVNPRHLAIDRPSHKFLAFLDKHYGLSHAIPQMYKFVVFQGFFRDRGEAYRSKRLSNGHHSAASKGRGTSSKNNQHLHQQIQQQQKQLHEQEQKLQQHESMQERSDAYSLPKILSASPPKSHRQSSSRNMAPVSTHVQLNGSNLASNMKSLSIREIAAEPNPAGDSPQVDLGHVKAQLPGPDQLQHAGSTSPIRREALSAPVGAAASPIQRDVTNWTAANLANGYTYEKGLSRNQRHTRLW